MAFSRLLVRAALSLSLIITSGCGAMSSATSMDSVLVVGSIAGAAAGAGVGGIVGSVLSNGDVAMSALLGAAIGVPAGIAIAAFVENQKTDGAIARNQSRIDDNANFIRTQESDIEALRNDMLDESSNVSPDESLKSNVYDGPTLGSYYR